MTRDRLTIGVVTPHAAPGPEVELPAMTRGRVATVVSRTGSPAATSQAPARTAPLAHAELRASTGLAALDRAAVTVQGRPLAAVAHASTTTGYVIGHREEAAVIERLSQRFAVPGRPGPGHVLRDRGAVGGVDQAGAARGGHGGHDLSSVGISTMASNRSTGCRHARQVLVGSPLQYCALGLVPSAGGCFGEGIRCVGV